MSDLDDFESSWNRLRPVTRGRGKRLKLKGRRFDRLVVIEYTKTRTKSGSALWSCQCDCGNFKNVSTDNLLKGKVKSCGCLLREKNLSSCEQKP